MTRIPTRIFCLFTTLAVVYFGGPVAATGQQPRPNPVGHSSDTAPSIEELRARLNLLRDELDRERKALADRKQVHESELAELREKRKALADRLLTAEIERIKTGEQLKRLRDDEINAAETSRTLVAEAKSMPISLRDAIEQLRIHLREVPGSDDAIDRLREYSSELDLSVESDDASAHADLLQSVFDEIESAHRDAMCVTVKPVSIYTASGERQQVKLLSLGHVRFAYESVAGGTVGLALSSPRDATGYRWSEELSGETRNLIRQAIKSVESNDATALVAIPVDPTGRIQPDTLSGDRGFFVRLSAGGLVMIPLAALALIALLLIAERARVFYLANPNADRRARDIISACRERDFEKARYLCDRGRGAVSRVLAACLSRRVQGERAMEDSIQEQMLQELPKLQRFMRGIVTLGAVAPLLGLLGTVTGIIRTFGVIRAFGNANPTLMAGGISEALVTTATGLVIAVPILIVHSLLRGRSDRIISDAERHAAVLLTTLVHDSTTTDNKSGRPAGESPGKATRHAAGGNGSETDEPLDVSQELALD